MIHRIVTIAALATVTFGADGGIRAAPDDPPREDVEAAFADVVLDLVGDDDPIVACAVNDVELGPVWYLCWSQARQGGGQGEFVLLRGVPDRGGYDDPDKNSPMAWDWDVTDVKTGESLARAPETVADRFANFTLSMCLVGASPQEALDMAADEGFDDWMIDALPNIINQMCG